MNIAKRLRALASRTALDGFADELRALATEIESAAPFGYFRAEPFGWTDCQATDKGAVALHEHPASIEWQEAVAEGLMVLHLPCPSDAREAVKALVAAQVRIAVDPAVSEQAARVPLTPGQRMRLWQNTEKGRSATSLAAFERIVQTTEAAHKITAPSSQPPAPSDAQPPS